MSDPYVCRGTDVLKNRLGLRNSDELARVERRLVIQRSREGVPVGEFDLTHLQDIHRHLFQDVYVWAGTVRTIGISRGGNLFLPPSRIVDAMHHVHDRLVRDRYLRGLTAERFAAAAADIMGDVNYIHSFREGNGRTQLQYLKLLAAQAGHQIDLGRIGGEAWIEASKEAHGRNLERMTGQILEALVLPTSRRAPRRPM